MLTLDQIKEYLASIGIVLPDFVLQLLLDSVNSINECLEENYDEATANLIRLYLMTLLGVSAADRYVTSQTAPSGASQSFKFKSLSERWNSTLGLLNALDTHGCTTGVIPPNPTTVARGGIWIGKGGCMCGDEE